MRTFLNFFCLTSFTVAFFCAPTFADPLPCRMREREQVRITKSAATAEIPTPLQKPQPTIPLECDRPFIYQTEVYSADSPQAQDASTLKHFVRNTPEAVKILNDYQSNRSKAKISAYTGTFGLLLFALSGPISGLFPEKDGSGRGQRDGIRGAFRIAGLSIAASGFFYGFTLLRSNESKIPNAVDQYNKNNPSDEIELKFTTSWSF